MSKKLPPTTRDEETRSFTARWSMPAGQVEARNTIVPFPELGVRREFHLM